MGLGIKENYCSRAGEGEVILLRLTLDLLMRFLLMFFLLLEKLLVTQKQLILLILDLKDHSRQLLGQMICL